MRDYFFRDRSVVQRLINHVKRDRPLRVIVNPDVDNHILFIFLLVVIDTDVGPKPQILNMDFGYLVSSKVCHQH